MKRTVSRYRKWLIFLLVSPGVVFASYLEYLRESGNFHTVVAEQAYRSRQLDYAELTYYLKTYKIKSILNLCGPEPGADWYVDEQRVAGEFHVKHFDYGISANSEVPDADLDAIMRTINDAPKPILIHCRSGADRRGLIAAIYQYTWGGSPAMEASGQLSVFYGHFPFFWNATAAIDRTFWRYVSTNTHT